MEPAQRYETAYELIVSTANSTSTGVIVDTGKVSNNATQYYFTPPSYDTPYYWFLRLWDDTDTPIAWRQFNTNGTKDWITDNFTRNSQIGNLQTFTSYRHEFPLPSFTWSPTQIVVATTSNSFISNSSYYTDANSLQTCSGVCSYNWSVSDAGAVITGTTSPSTSILFTRATNTSVTLSATDDDTYTCSTSTLLDVNFLLPTWKEVKAQ